MESENKVEKAVPSNESQKKIRHRKKQLYHSILKQMEFYFGDANLSKDRFLGALIKEDPYIPLTTFLKFNKIKSLTDNIEDIAKSVSNSEILKLSEDEKNICRVTPIKERTNLDECTVYVECLPPNIDHDWLRNIFVTFGPVSYISVPRFKHNKKIKGFAFIEFEDPSSAAKCLEAFEEAGAKLLPMMNPDDLCSITSFEDPNQPKVDDKENDKAKENEQEKCEIKMEEDSKTDTKLKTQKRKAMESDSSCDEQVQKKKSKVKSEADASKDSIEKKTDQESSSTNTEKKTVDKPILTDNTSGVETEDNEAETCPEAKKKKRKRKKQVKKYRESIASTGLKILSKKEWKKLRNKYLDLQRSKMRQLKKQLHLNRVNENSQKYPVQYQQNFYGGSDNTEMNQEEVVVPSTTVEFTPGVIVHLKLKEPCVEVKRFKAAIKNISEEIKYIDIQEGSSDAHLRFSDNANASKFPTLLEEATSIHTPDIIEMVNQISSQVVLSGEPEQEYWKKLARDRDNKRNKKVKLEKRGRDKLIAKAVKNSHVHFDDE